jgi:hypothetical protein
MGKRKFSSDELYVLRNDIPVAVLIENGLKIPTHRRDGRFCYLCPVCKEFNTAVSSRTNQARCYTCEKLFNTIDLVMEERQWGFVDSARFLSKFYANMPQRSEQKDVSSATSYNQLERSGREEASRAPEHIGNILTGVMSAASSVASNPSSHNTGNQESINPKGPEASNDRILALEQKLESLSRQVEKIVTLINQNPPH